MMSEREWVNKFMVLMEIMNWSDELKHVCMADGSGI
jgi:hypothetical protein